MKLEELTEKHIEEVFRLYELHFGFDKNFKKIINRKPSEILENLKEELWNKHGGYKEYQIGSRWSSDSKLFFETNCGTKLRIRFSPELQSKELLGKEFYEAEEAGNKFEESVNKYFESQTI